ncbi:hypothetical protein SAMN05216232_0799 [Virgibacillus subterraneus]|uniref:SLH domain-containing protein n=1 Tax=Virgibacillus subterraneus TaxID=621109 RepID=A0A1H9AGW6_9BACI|nr:hypothetical protein SAMN05216232_0799 [Virgibacillus subterraneus]
MGNKIFLSSPHMSVEDYEKEYVKEPFDTNWIAALSKNVSELLENGVCLPSDTEMKDIDLSRVVGVIKGLCLEK